jgi:membrane protein
MATEEQLEEAGGEAGNRVQRIWGWLLSQSDKPLGRLGMDWFRRYFAASRNSGCAISIYSSLSVLPAALAFVALAYHGTGNMNVFAQHLVNHLNLTGETATLVQSTFGSASSNALAATLTMVVTFFFWGIGIGQLYQDVYARAWGITVATPADQVLYAIFFFVFAGALTGVLIVQSEFGDTGRWAILIPVWIVGSLAFWLGTPIFLLHRKIELRKLLPGAVLATIVLGGTAAVSPLFIPATMTTNGKAFGSFGIALTLIGYLFVMVTLSLVCAVFSPVWLEWRAGEKSLSEESAQPDSPPALSE